MGAKGEDVKPVVADAEDQVVRIDPSGFDYNNGHGAVNVGDAQALLAQALLGLSVKAGDSDTGRS